MAYYLHDDVLDDGLTELPTTVALHVNSALPSDYATALSTSLGNKTPPAVNAPSDYGSPDGRQVQVDAITDGDVTTTGTATHWSLVDGSRLLAAQTLEAPVAVTLGHKFTLDAFFVALPTNPAA